jgi:hypothetical protein
VYGEIRGYKQLGSYAYFVVGSSVFRVDAAKNADEIGTIATTTGRVGIESNGLDLIVVDGTGGWVWNLTAETWTQIVDSDFPLCRDVVVTDGYYLVPKIGTGQIWRSDYNDGLSWGGLAFSTAGSDPDNIVAIIVDNKDIYTIGERSTEIWQNNGAATFNFIQLSSAFIQVGGTGTFARAGANNAIYWMGKDKNGQGQFFQCVGRIPANKATPAIIREFQSWGDLSDVEMWTYEQQGHNFVVVTSPSAGKTFVYDSSVDQWHERSTRILGVDGHWRISGHVLFNNIHLVGDYINGKIYELKTDSYDEDGETMVAVRRTPVMRNRQDRITCHSIKLITEPGVGLESGDDEDVNPNAILRWSKDGGRTWSSGVNVPLGATGEVENESEVTQLGQGKNWVFEWIISARVKRILLGAIAQVTVDD